MLQLRNPDPHLLFGCARGLRRHAFAAAILQTSLPMRLEFLHPGIDLLIAYVMLDGRFSVIAPILQAVLYDGCPFFLCGLSPLLHVASS